MVVTGIPVRSAFGGGQPRQDGDRELLIMGGGLGLMPRKDGFYEELDALRGVHTTILTGKNEKLYRRLAGKYAHIEVVSFTDRVYEYMGRAHLMLSKPGGITTFEAIAAQLPMLAWEPFLAQERENAHFLVAAGMGRVAPKGEADCLAAIRACIYDDALLAGMRSTMEKMGRSCRPQAVGQVVLDAAREANRTAQRPRVKEAWA
jgi:UDP-N-acetylglucosamine:LPS N-acetylglucosamine transferase